MYGRVLAVLAVAVVISAGATGNPLLVRLGYVLCAVLAVGAALTWTSVRWVDLRRQTRSRRAEVGALAEETFAVRNTSWLPKPWLEVLDASDLPAHHASRALTAIGPGRSRSWTVRTRCRRRGAYTLGPMTLVGGDPLGVFRVERTLPQTVPFVVFPRTVPLRGLGLPTGYLSGGQVVRRRADFATTNVRGVRGYQPGDPFNRIHWPTTARRGRLYTKEFELDPLADFWLVLDLDAAVHVGEPLDAAELEALDWADAREPAIEPTTEEYCVTAAASVARHLLDQGKSVGLIAHGQRRVVVQPDRGDRQLLKLLSNLAVLSASGRSSLAQVLGAENLAFTRHTTVIVVTPTPTLRWIEVLREMRHRGVGSIVVLVEASTFGGAADSLPVVSALVAHNVPCRLVKLGDDLANALNG
jgi:uncharacterized protein (DUF58 family)